MAEEPTRQPEVLGATHATGAPVEAPRLILEKDVAAFVVEELLSRDRKLPVVAVTTRLDSTRPSLDPDALATRLQGQARVVVLETGPSTHALGQALPTRLSVHGGAVRIWRPGLTKESDPAAHPLIFVPVDRVEVARHRVLCELGLEAGPYRAPAAIGDTSQSDPRTSAPSTAVARGSRMTRTNRHILKGHVESIDGPHVRVRTSAGRGVVKFADFPIIELANSLRPGDSIQVFHLDVVSYGPLQYSVQGLIPRPKPVETKGTSVGRAPSSAVSAAPPVRLNAPLAAPSDTTDPWVRAAEIFRSGDVLRGRVCRVEKLFVLIEVLPGAAMVCPIRELDWQYVADASSLFTVGEVVRVILLSIDAGKRKGVVSVKRAYAEPWPPPVSLEEGGSLFLPDTPNESGDDGERSEKLNSQLVGLERENEELQQSLSEARATIAALRKSLKENEGRLATMEQAVAAEDPRSSPVAFLRAVRIEYARQFDESDRQKYPLARMRVGGEFMERLAAIEGVSTAIIVKVCCQVAAGRAHEVTARQVHHLHMGQGGTKVRTRSSDRAVAWRCSLQDGTASARRLHWWDVPGGASGVQRTIEFATVNLHDDDSIPS
jgi:predicted RNA-binding protein with RPS1 domain